MAVHSSMLAQRITTKQEMQVRSLGWGNPLEKEMAIHEQRNLTGYSPWGHESQT